jgi:hypothetical protein
VGEYLGLNQRSIAEIEGAAELDPSELKTFIFEQRALGFFQS